MISEFADKADPGEKSDSCRTVVGSVTPGDRGFEDTRLEAVLSGNRLRVFRRGMP